MTAIEPCCSFEPDMLNYFDFLECLLRIACAYKFKPEEEAHLVDSTARRVDFLIKEFLIPKFEAESLNYI